MVEIASKSFVGGEQVLSGGDRRVVTCNGVDEGGEGCFDTVELGLDEGIHDLKVTKEKYFSRRFKNIYGSYVGRPGR